MLDRFKACLAEILDIEGRYSNDPHDRGGPTCRGVTQATYDAFRQAKGAPPRDVRMIDAEELTELYLRNYWLPSHAPELPAGLDLAAFDFAVNSGPTRAIKVLQQALDVPADGHYGVVTEAAIKRALLPRVIQAYLEARRAYLRGLPTFWKFGNGWMNRCARIEASALDAAGAHEWAADARVDVAPPPEDLDERSAEQGRAVPEDARPPVMAEIGAASSGAGSVAYVAPNVISRSFVGGRFSVVAFAAALAAEPMFWAGLVMVWGAVAMWIWRRKHARAVI